MTWKVFSVSRGSKFVEIHGREGAPPRDLDLTRVPTQRLRAAFYSIGKSIH